MSTSIIQQKVTDPEFEDSAYSYVGDDIRPTNTFPSNPTISNYNYTFSVAKSGYKAVGVVTSTTNTDSPPTNNGSPCSFNYNNQTATIFCRPKATSTASYPRINAKIKYLKL